MYVVFCASDSLYRVNSHLAVSVTDSLYRVNSHLAVLVTTNAAAGPAGRLCVRDGSLSGEVPLPDAWGRALRQPIPVLTRHWTYLPWQFIIFL
jgi:hypothetical protein